MTKLNRIYWVAVFATLPLLLTMAACSDDDGPTATPSAAQTATTQPAANIPTTTDTSAPSPQPTAGAPATIEIAADPQQLVCDGVQASRVTATVKDAAGVAVADGTPIKFSVQALGTADPIDTVTTNGEASTSVVALGQQAGVVVNVTSGEAAAAIRIDCQ